MKNHVAPIACETHERALIDLADGALAPQRERELRAHLLTCRGCRSWFAGYGAISDRLVQALAPAHAPADFEARLHQRLAAERSAAVADAAQLLRRAEDERRRGLRAMRDEARVRAVVGAVNAAGMAACALGVLYLLRPMLDRGLQQFAALNQLFADGAIGGAVALAALATLAALGWRRGGLLPG